MGEDGQNGSKKRFQIRGPRKESTGKKSQGWQGSDEATTTYRSIDVSTNIPFRPSALVITPRRGVRADLVPLNHPLRVYAAAEALILIVSIIYYPSSGRSSSSRITR